MLASASPRRLALLAQIGVTPVLVLPADLDETPRKGELPLAHAQRLAAEKARAAQADSRVAALGPAALVLAADTVVALGRRILPKALSRDEARGCLARLSGRRHAVLSAVALAGSGGILRERVCLTRVKVKRLSEEEIARYLDSGEWQGKAGGYAIQGLAAAFIPWIAGSYSNVVGLPLAETWTLLDSASYHGRSAPAAGAT